MSTQIDQIDHHSGSSAADTTDLAKLQEFAGKVAADRAVAYNGVLVYLGDRLGLWRALGAIERTTSEQLAQSCGLAERYVREWLSAQAAAGYVEYEPATTTFSLPAEHAMVLADEDSPAAGVAGFEVIAAVWASADRLAHAYATGDGVGLGRSRPPPVHRCRPVLLHVLPKLAAPAEWIPAVDGLIERLESGIQRPRRRLWPRLSNDPAGGGLPRLHLRRHRLPRGVGTSRVAAAEEAGVADRVRFEVGDASSYTGSYDLVCYFDAVHDLGDPVGALAHAPSALAPVARWSRSSRTLSDRLEDNLANPMALTLLRRQFRPCASRTACPRVEPPSARRPDRRSW